MANELQTRDTTGSSVYAIIRNYAARPFNGTTFEAWNDAHYSTYVVDLTEQGSDGYFSGDFPTIIVTAGTYGLEFFHQVTGSPLETDSFIAGGNLVWDGTQSTGNDVSGATLTSLYFTKQVNNITTSTDDAVLTALLFPASAQIQNYCNNQFFLRDYNEYYDGTNDYKLILNQTPVTAIDTVTLNPYASTPETVAGTNYIIESKPGIIHLKPTSTATFYFYNGCQNIQVAYSAGYSSIPQDVQLACAQLVGNLYFLRDGRFTEKEALGDYSVSYSQVLEAFGSELKMLLNPYKHHRV